MPRRGGRRKKRHTEKTVDDGERKEKLTPRCLVLKRGKVGTRVQGLVQDFRDVMMPNCARRLKESKMNRLEDFMAVAGELNVSHLVIFTASKRHTWMKLAKMPQGPTLTFQVDSFSLASDVRATQKRAGEGPRDLLSAPLQVLNGFAGGGQDTSGMRNLTSEMLRGLFPAVDVAGFNQAECRRTALFSYDSEKETIYFRHFTVGRRPVGLQRGVSKLLRPSRLPQLGRCNDVADYILGGGLGGASESEVEDLHEVPLPGKTGRTAIRLQERGPRLSLLLVKAEEGVCNGSVLYHRYSTKTPSQIEVWDAKAKQRNALRQRNERLEMSAGAVRAQRRERAKREREAEEDAGGEEGLKPDEDGFIRGAASEGRAKKSKRYHPFAWGKKKKKEEQDKEGKKPAGDRKSQRQQTVLDRFHKSRRTGEK